ncbi:MAG: porin [Pseudomonadota bacterium]
MTALPTVAAASYAILAPAPATLTPPPEPIAAPVVAAETGSTIAGPADLLFSLLDLDFALGPWTFRGYINVDSAEYDQDPAGPLDSDFRRGAIGDDSPGSARDMGGGAYLRRARLGGEGTLGEHIAYRAMFELGANRELREPKIAEVWISYRRFKPYVIQLGAYPAPANMSDAANSDSTLFLERTTAGNLARNLGAGDGRLSFTVRRSDPRWMAAVSLTGPLLDAQDDYSPQAAIVGRFSRALDTRFAGTVHLGMSGTYVLVPPKAERAKDGGASFPVRLAATPEIGVDDTVLIDTGEISARRANVIGVEAATQRRNLYAQAEVFRFGIDRREDGPGGEDPHFWGFYVQGSWILTGEQRRFDRSRATFTFPEPARPLGEGGWGAWEVGLRYSRMNLNYEVGRAGELMPPGAVRGGDQSILAVSLAWYPRRRVRLMLNYSQVSVDRLNPASAIEPEPFGPAPETPPPGAQIGQDLNILALRLRYSF